MIETAEGESAAALGAIRAVTCSVPDLEVIERAYVNELGYAVATRGFVGSAQACAWGMPDTAGLAMLTLAPASGEAVFLRFIEDPHAAGWTALTTFGWNATEFIVQNVDELAHRLEGGAFRIIGPPRPLTRFPQIRAMQVLGPAGECCYFTQVAPECGLDLAVARCYVGRVFIVVAAGPDADALYAPYAQFGNSFDPPVATPVAVISKAHNLPLDTPHRHGLIRLPEGTRIELDEYPRTARPRSCVHGRLPPGMAIVSFSIRSFDHYGPLVGPAAPAELPGSKGMSACLRGTAGELIEIITEQSVHSD
jgi:hypothetical protein